ncbi:receptor-like protein 7 [Eucalyptus grandis]|uniref:receptor-like protein 7 n=1 Tax=Eucalyptus grandis TaxID=71139 RepID=UPI00192EA9A7|nr:receptor-like protein 7 [Eucalyptus grandis]
MACSSCFYMFIHFLFLYLSSQPIGVHNLYLSMKPLCLEDEKSALLQFKERYDIAKTLSWKISQDCCSWEGIECDENTGHVIVLNLGSSSLYGSIDNNSTLFQLTHLEKLILSDNHFYSQIPSRVGDLSRLTHLDLSASVYSGQVPTEIFKLTRLVYLNLCCNPSLYDPYHYNFINLLEMKALGLRSLVQNMTSLEELHLGFVNMSSQVPNTLANLSSLRSLDMDWCDLHGEFPSAIFHLPKLRYLGVGDNSALTGRLPNFNSSSPLEELRLQATSFSGELPSSIGILPSLSYLDVTQCKFSGSIPASLANLSNLKDLSVSANPFTTLSISSISWVWKKKKLTNLALEMINLYGEIPPSIGNLSQLHKLSLNDNQLSSAIPSQLMNLTQLTILDLGRNQLSGSIPSWLMNMTQLVELDLAVNKFQGEIPSSISQLQNLMFLRLFENNFNGTIELDNFHKYRQLQVLQLSYNRLSGCTSSANLILPRLLALGLASCKSYSSSTFSLRTRFMQFKRVSSILTKPRGY